MAPKGLSGACCGPSGEVSGAPTGRGPACSAARDGDGLGVLRWSRGGTSAFSGAGPVRDGGGTGGGSAAQAGAGPACSAAQDRGGTGSSEVQTGRAAPPGRKKSVPRGRCAAARAQKGLRRKGAPPPEHIRAQKNGPRSVHFHSATLLPLPCYPTGCCSGMLVRYTLPHDNGSALREPVSFAGDFRQHVLLQQPVCLRFRSARRSGVTAVKASAIRSLSRSAARRSGLSRLAAGISAVRVAPRESRRPPPGSQFSAARGHSSQPPSGPISQPSGVSAVRSPELAVPAARPLRRRGHSTTTSVWPSTCSWRISCIELT